MRVLHVINQLSGRAGAEVSLRDLVVATAGRVDHGIVVLRAEPNVLDEVHAAGADTFVPEADLRGWAARVAHVTAAIDRFDPDLVHTSLFDADVAGRLAARRRRRPCLVSVVNTPYAAEAAIDQQIPGVKRFAVRAIDRALLRWTTHVHAITDAVAEAAVVHLGIDRRRITVVPRGRDGERFAPADPGCREAVRRRLGLAADATVLLAVGREEAQKGHTYLLAAVAAVARDRPDVQLVHAGRPGGRTAAIEARLAADPDLAARVHRLGVRTDVVDLLRAADLFVFPSLYEGLGVSVIEAMATGVPIVAGDSPAVREVLDGGRCGRLVPVADADALAGAITAALADREGTAAMAAAARERFLERYELARVADAMVELWQATAAAGTR
jgi:glycosyltransferase involved in cell wall biosynthesis